MLKRRPEHLVESLANFRTTRLLSLVPADIFVRSGGAVIVLRFVEYIAVNSLFQYLRKPSCCCENRGGV
jgi:hypothetical protein